MATTNEEQKIKEFISLCRENGLSVTPQRLSIYKAIIGDTSHPKPEDVYKRIEKEHPTISLATVYKTLETFERYGIITVVTPLHNTVRYDTMTQPHHHIVCVKCKKVIDLFDDQLKDLPVPEKVTKDNRLLSFSIQYNVVCAECRRQQS